MYLYLFILYKWIENKCLAHEKSVDSTLKYEMATSKTITKTAEYRDKQKITYNERQMNELF